MKCSNILVTGQFFIVLFVICASSEAQTNNHELEEAKKAIAASNAIYFESFAKNDSSIFINRYSKDACILAPNRLCAGE